MPSESAGRYRFGPNCATKSFEAKKRSKKGSLDTIADANRSARSANGTTTGRAVPSVSSFQSGAAASANTIEDGLQAMFRVTPEKSSFGSTLGAGVAGAAVA